MDLQQIIALALVAASVAVIVHRLRRMRKRRHAGPCASCPAADGRPVANPPQETAAGNRGPV